MEESYWPYSWISYYHQKETFVKTDLFFKWAKTLSINRIPLRGFHQAHLVWSSVTQMFTWLALKKEADRFIKKHTNPSSENSPQIFLKCLPFVIVMDVSVQVAAMPLSFSKLLKDSIACQASTSKALGKAGLKRSREGRHSGAWCPVLHYIPIFLALTPLPWAVINSFQPLFQANPTSMIIFWNLFAGPLPCVATTEI